MISVKPSELLLWEILVPTQYNDGKPIRTRHHRVWDVYVRRISGGLTLYKPALGQWIDKFDSKLYHERMIPVRIACNEKQIKQIAEFTIKHYKQLQVMTYVVSEKVIFFKEKKVANKNATFFKKANHVRKIRTKNQL